MRRFLLLAAFIPALALAQQTGGGGGSPGGSSGNVQTNNGAGGFNGIATTGSGSAVLATSPTLVTPTLGAATATSLNGNTFSTGTYTLTGVAAKTLTFNNTLTLAGTDSTTMTFPGTTDSIPGIGANNSFTGNNGMSGTLSITNAAAAALNITGGMLVGSAKRIGWTSRGILTSPASGTTQFGDVDASAPVAQILDFQNASSGNTDIAGQNATFNGSQGTGAGAGGKFIFKTAPAGTTGTSVNAEVTAFTIDNVGHLVSGGASPTCGTGCASVTGNDTAMVVTTGSAVTSIAVNFGKTWGAAPTCVANGDAATGFTFVSAVSTTVLTLGASAAFTSDKIYIHCLQ